jgi:hypothetical protein
MNSVVNIIVWPLVPSAFGMTYWVIIMQVVAIIVIIEIATHDSGEKGRTNRPKSISCFVGVHTIRPFVVMIVTNDIISYLSVVQIQALSDMSYFALIIPPITPAQFPLQLYGPDLGKVPRSPSTYLCDS